MLFFIKRINLTSLKFLACCNSVSIAASYTFAFNIFPKYPSVVSSTFSVTSSSFTTEAAVDLRRSVVVKKAVMGAAAGRTRFAAEGLCCDGASDGKKGMQVRQPEAATPAAVVRDHDNDATRRTTLPETFHI